VDTTTSRSSLVRTFDRIPALSGGLSSVTGLLREARSFGLIGLANAVADILLFTLLHAGVGVGPLSAKVVSGFLTIVISYYANRRWTWPHRPGQAQQRRQLLQFAAISGGGLLLAEACLGVSHYMLGMHSILADNLSANVIGLGLGTVWRFVACRRWVFTATAEDAYMAGEWDEPDWDDPDWATARIHRVSLTELLSTSDATAKQAV
jgi:putative flippase GtrA